MSPVIAGSDQNAGAYLVFLISNMMMMSVSALGWNMGRLAASVFLILGIGQFAIAAASPGASSGQKPPNPSPFVECKAPAIAGTRPDIGVASCSVPFTSVGELDQVHFTWDNGSEASLTRFQIWDLQLVRDGDFTKVNFIIEDNCWPNTFVPYTLAANVYPQTNEKMAEPPKSRTATPMCQRPGSRTRKPR